MEEKKEYTILTIDDNPVNLRMLSALLQEQGFDSVQADGGHSGLDMASRRKPDLILLDINMPDMDGYEVCRQLKGDPDLRSIPVLMVSGEYEVEAKVRCFQLGAADYITKPYNRDEIMARIRTHLSLMQLTRNLEESNAMLTEKQRLLNQDLEAAGEIQKALLPQSFPDLKNIKFSFSFSPCERIGGDLFNVQILDENHLGVYILDVSGHGVPAAMLTALVHQSLLPQSGTVKQYFQEPPHYRLSAPTAVFDLLEVDFPIERFNRYFTMAYLVLDIFSGRFNYSCAGHPPILQVSADGKITRHQKGGAMIGVGSLGGDRTEGTGQLKKGDRLFFYTDGIIENENRQGVPYGRERLEQLLCSGCTLDLDTLTAKTMGDLAAFSENLPFQDDITLLAMALWE